MSDLQGPLCRRRGMHNTNLSGLHSQIKCTVSIELYQNGKEQCIALCLLFGLCCPEIHQTLLHVPEVPCQCISFKEPESCKELKITSVNNSVIYRYVVY